MKQSKPLAPALSFEKFYTLKHLIPPQLCKKNDRYFYTAEQVAIKCCKNAKKHRKYKKLLQIPASFARL